MCECIFCSFLYLLEHFSTLAGAISRLRLSQSKLNPFKIPFPILLLMIPSPFCTFSSLQLMLLWFPLANTFTWLCQTHFVSHPNLGKSGLLLRLVQIELRRSVRYLLLSIDRFSASNPNTRLGCSRKLRTKKFLLAVRIGGNDGAVDRWCLSNFWHNSRYKWPIWRPQQHPHPPTNPIFSATTPDRLNLGVQRCLLYLALVVGNANSVGGQSRT